MLKYQKDINITRYEINRNNSGHLPSFYLVAKYRNDDIGEASLNANKTEETSVTLQLNIPLYQGR